MCLLKRLPRGETNFNFESRFFDIIRVATVGVLQVDL